MIVGFNELLSDLIGHNGHLAVAMEIDAIGQGPLTAHFDAVSLQTKSTRADAVRVLAAPGVNECLPLDWTFVAAQEVVA